MKSRPYRLEHGQAGVEQTASESLPPPATCWRRSTARRLVPSERLATQLFLPDEFQPATHLFCRRAVLPAHAVNLQSVIVDNRQRGLVHVLVFCRVEIAATDEAEHDLVRRGLRIGLHARLIPQHAV